MTDGGLLTFDYLGNIGASLNIAAFSKWLRTIKKNRSETKPSHWFRYYKLSKQYNVLPIKKFS